MTSWEGQVAGIFVAPAAAETLLPVPSLNAVEGRGLEGDRYFLKVGTYSDLPGTGRQVTLIEREAIEALEREHHIAIPPGGSRRNIETTGVALNHLVGKDFVIGGATLRGMRLCEPCAHLASLTKRGIVKGLVHRGGLRAEIVKGGRIAVGDAIRPL